MLFLTNISAQINYSYIPREYVDFRVSTSGLSNANPYTICKGLQNDGGYFVTGLVRRSNQNDLFLNHLKKNDSIDWTLNIQTDGNEGGEIIDLVPISNSELILSSETYSPKPRPILPLCTRLTPMDRLFPLSLLTHQIVSLTLLKHEYKTYKYYVRW